MESYITLAEVKEQANIPAADTRHDAVLSALIVSVSRQIDTYCRRWFYEHPQVRRFDYPREAGVQREASWNAPSSGMMYRFGQGQRLWLDADLLRVTTFINGNGQPIPPDHYTLYPLMGPPYRWIELRPEKGSVFLWHHTTQGAITVDGVWGDTRPMSRALVKQACAFWVQAQSQQIGDNAGVTSKSISGFSVSYEQGASPIVDDGVQSMQPPSAVVLLLQSIVFRDIRGVNG